MVSGIIKSGMLIGSDGGGGLSLPISQRSGVILYAENPIGSTSADWDVTDSALIKHGTLNITSGSGIALDTSGYTTTGSYGTYLHSRDGSCPAYTTARRFDVWGKVTGLPTTNTGVYLEYDWQDTNNMWYTYLIWTSTLYSLVTVEYSGASPTVRNTSNLASSAAYPAYFHFGVIVQGDYQSHFATVFETDDTAAGGTGTNAATEYQASRPFKTSYNFALRNYGAPGTVFAVKGFKVTDL